MEFSVEKTGSVAFGKALGNRVWEAYPRIHLD